MNDSQTRLHELLQQLHDELERTTGVDAESRQTLEHLKKDIEVALKSADTTPLGKRLNDSVAQLETSHPQITLVIKELLDHLAAV